MRMIQFDEGHCQALRECKKCINSYRILAYNTMDHSENSIQNLTNSLNSSYPAKKYCIVFG